jgi:hypothetical protein
MEFGRARFSVIRDSSPRIRGRALGIIDRSFNGCRDASFRSIRDAGNQKKKHTMRVRSRKSIRNATCRSTFPTPCPSSCPYRAPRRCIADTSRVMTPNDRECVNPGRGTVAAIGRSSPEPIEKLLVGEIDAGCCRSSKTRSRKRISRTMPPRHRAEIEGLIIASLADSID